VKIFWTAKLLFYYKWVLVWGLGWVWLVENVLFLGGFFSKIGGVVGLCFCPVRDKMLVENVLFCAMEFFLNPPPRIFIPVPLGTICW